MNHPGEAHPLSNLQHNLPVLTMPPPARPPEYERDGHDVDLKGYFNILYLINGGAIGLGDRIMWTSRTRAIWGAGG
jgi:hypothetical protein